MYNRQGDMMACALLLNLQSGDAGSIHCYNRMFAWLDTPIPSFHGSAQVTISAIS
jgi:hypothetical protein